MRKMIKTKSEQLVGQVLHDVNLACEMIMLEFESISIHSQCFTRILNNDDVFLTTFDYKNWEGVKDTNNDELYNLAINKN